MLFAPVRQALPDAAELDRAIRTVLARPEFAERELPSLLQGMVDLYSSIREAFWHMILDLDALGESAPLLSWLIKAWLLISLIAVLAHLATTAVRAWRARDRSDGSSRRPASRTAGERERAATWESRASEKAAEGRFREAAFALYRAVLLRLQERDALSYDPSKTPGDYRREANADAPGGSVLHVFLRHFEPIAFGGRPVSARVYTGLEFAAREAGVRVQ